MFILLVLAIEICVLSEEMIIEKLVVVWKTIEVLNPVK